MERAPSKIEYIKKKLSPRRYYHDMAEYGLLDDILETKLRDEFNSDESFRNDMIEVLYNHAPKPSTVLDRFYLEKLCESLSYFTEYTKPCLKQKH